MSTIKPGDIHTVARACQILSKLNLVHLTAPDALAQMRVLCWRQGGLSGYLKALMRGKAALSLSCFRLFADWDGEKEIQAPANYPGSLESYLVSNFDQNNLPVRVDFLGEQEQTYFL